MSVSAEFLADIIATVSKSQAERDAQAVVVYQDSDMCECGDLATSCFCEE